MKLNSQNFIFLVFITYVFHCLAEEIQRAPASSSSSTSHDRTQIYMDDDGDDGDERDVVLKILKAGWSCYSTAPVVLVWMNFVNALKGE